MQNEAEVLKSCNELYGKTLLQLAQELNIAIPTQPVMRKGWAGKAIEQYFGITNQLAAPDFVNLGIELKTLPIGLDGKPNASTFITYISLDTHYRETWLTSRCYHKLQRVLWVPIEADASVPYFERRIAKGFLWSPNKWQWKILEQDWTELSEIIVTGNLNKISAKYGKALQIRPKSADNKAVTTYYDLDGISTKTLPRGFYLRRSFSIID